MIHNKRKKSLLEKAGGEARTVCHKHLEKEHVKKEERSSTECAERSRKMKTKNMSGTKIIYLGLNDVEVVEDTSEHWWSQRSDLSLWGINRRYRSN